MTTLNVTFNSSSSSLNKDIWVCEETSFRRFTKGIFYGENPLNCILSMFILVASLNALSSTCLQFLLNPIGTSTFVPQVLAGLLMGHSVSGTMKRPNKLFLTTKPFYICETISLFGSMVFLFMVGIKIDPCMMLRTGKKTWAISLCSGAFPLLFNTISTSVLRHVLNPESDIYKSLFFIAVFLSTGSFHVTASLLEDLKLLNSEVGQLALSSSMLNGAISSFWQSVFARDQILRKRKDNSAKLMIMSLVALTCFIFCVLRPIMFWMIRRTPRGKPIKQSYIIFIFFMMLGCSFTGELIGGHFLIGPAILGLAVPEGPPLGSALVEKLETMVSTVLMPLFYFTTGAKCNLSLIDGYSLAIVQPVALYSFLGKVIGTMVPSLFCNISLIDAFSLGLILSAQGITHLQYLHACLHFHVINDQTYAQMIVSLVWLQLVATPIVKFIYDPSKSYLSIDKRNIEHASPNAVLPLMACIHFEENTPPIINVLEMSNSTIESPVCFHVLHLIQLTGRLAPVLIDHQLDNNSTSLESSQSQHIMNAFKSYQQQNMGNVMMKLFTSISPYDTMHDEICTLAAEKRVCMLIIPFHMQWRMTEMSKYANLIKSLNRRLLNTAPCSVGILVERGMLIWNNPLNCVSFYSVGIVFIEGPDDREALTYGMRMANNSNVTVTLIRLLDPCNKSKNSIDRDPDNDLIHKFKVEYNQIKRHDYKEEVVADGVEMINFIRSLEGCYDLVLAGRSHENKSSLFSEIREWREYPELGSIGDMLVSPDSAFEGSVLVVQQQKRVGIGHDDFPLDSSIYSKQSTSESPFEV